MQHFEVRHDALERILQETGHHLATLPKGYGFALFLFNFGPEGATFYISNAQREDMIRLLEEFIERVRKEGGGAMSEQQRAFDVAIGHLCETCFEPAWFRCHSCGRGMCRKHVLALPGDEGIRICPSCLAEFEETHRQAWP